MGSISLSSNIGLALAQRNRVAADPFFSNVRLLMHCDGAHGSAAFVESSANRPVTAFGNVQMTTAVQQFGLSSATYDGTGDYLQVPNGGTFDFANSDFTLEAWVRKTTNEARRRFILSTRYINVNNRGWEFYVSTTETLEFVGYDGAGGANIVLAGVATLSNSAWHHVAVSRVGANTRIFLNGVVDVTDATSGNIANGDTNLTIGRFIEDTTRDWAGQHDEIRITAGGRYTTGFTPSGPFPDF